MNIKIVSITAAVLALAGCATVSSTDVAGIVSAADAVCYDVKDPVVGNWGLKLPYDEMNAGHMIVTRDASGAPQALVLWRWASPIPMKSCTVNGDSFEIVHPWDMKIVGRVDGMKLSAKVYSTKDDNKLLGDVTGWRNPPVCDKLSTKDAQFGEPIDLLAGGLDGWKTMNPNAVFGWSIKDENGAKVLSNCLPVDEKGKKIHGANLMSVRNDFYDFNLSYDVRVPKDSNSGVYLRGRYEIQTLDSYGKKVDKHNMAAYYGRVTPSVAAEKPAGEWQHVDVTLYKRHLTVVLNGTTIIDNTPVVGITGGAIDANEFVPGPLYLQGDHSDADYKNMILRKAVN